METENKVLQVPIEDIIPNRFQPRLSFDENSLKELADSIKQHGIIQPLVLRRVADKYEIIAGERRYKAAMMAGLASVPAVLANLDDNTSAEVAIVENVQRKDLTAIEEARSYKALLDKGYMTQEDLAKKMGLSQAAVSNKLRLLNLDESVQDAILNEKISERHARSLLKIKDLEEQKKMLNRIITERLTVRQLEEEIKKMNIEEPVVTAPVEEKKVEETSIKAESVAPAQVEEKPQTFGSIFTSSNPSQIPNKFFNFLEDEAVNMTMEEPSTPNVASEPSVTNTESPVAPTAPVEPVAPSVTVEEPEEIEMLDFITPEEPKSSYVDEVKTKINDLNLDLSKVTITDEDTLTEHIIKISIKKD